MSTAKISVNAIVCAPAEKVWDYYSNPVHIIKWNFADESWHCPWADNNFQVNGMYKARMEAKDGSNGFDIEAVYTEIIPGKQFSYVMSDGRGATVIFDTENGNTKVSIHFDAENENPVELQKNGWQAILNNFKHYTESN